MQQSQLKMSSEIKRLQNLIEDKERAKELDKSNNSKELEQKVSSLSALLKERGVEVTTLKEQLKLAQTSLLNQSSQISQLSQNSNVSSQISSGSQISQAGPKQDQVPGEKSMEELKQELAKTKQSLSFAEEDFAAAQRRITANS